jgi:hypothetical protein
VFHLPLQNKHFCVIALVLITKPIIQIKNSKENCNECMDGMLVVDEQLNILYQVSLSFVHKVGHSFAN